MIKRKDAKIRPAPAPTPLRSFAPSSRLRASGSKSALVREACADFPDTPTKTLARKLYAEHGQLWPTLDACYQAVRSARGNHGEKMRRECRPTHYRPNQPAGFTWRFPASSAETWEPFVLDSGRTLVLSDLHIPFHDPKAIHALIRHGKTFLRPDDCILLNGDVCDFFSISRFDKNPTKSALKKEIELTRQFLGWLRQQFPRQRIVYKFGNHDEWFSKYLWRKAPELFSLPQVALDHLLTQPIGAEPAIGGIDFLTEQEKITAGHLDILHGHELGKGSIAPPVNPARGFFLKTLECTLAGHLHRASIHRERTSKGKQIACWSTGCLCGLWPDYAKINKWDHSAARLDLQGDNFQVTPLRIINGKIV
jgi:predicted phosphodiesterase